MPNYDFFQNKECEYFPCHAGADKESFSCLFCYCPLYCLGAGVAARRLPHLVQKAAPSAT